MMTKGKSKTPLKLGLLLLLCPLLLWLVLLVILPQLTMLNISLQERVAPRIYEYGFSNYIEFFTEPLYWNTFLRTAVMSIIATVLTLIIAFPISYYIAKMLRGRAKGLLLVLCLIPFWVSELVRTYGWMILLRESGVVSSFLQYIGMTEGPIEFLYTDATIMLGLVYSSMLFMVVPLTSTLESLDDSYIEAGYDLGGNGLSVFWQIIVPHAKPAIISGCIVVFMLTLGNYLTPILLGGKSSLWFTEQIFTQFITRFNWQQGSAFGVLLLSISSLIVWLGLKLSRQSFSKVMS
ncbi:ABC transporter permease [Psychromonas sp. SP041]|jgi:spermidine/putrescine transport system permease protein|uniref:ABC transporter permease n=1 Tax=Psychromonas sp. SP041 TaxID=1365007 RepID=UPI0003FF158B|nr:ABC transporter permease [Psychromonas sp. SP041]